MYSLNVSESAISRPHCVYHEPSLFPFLYSVAHHKLGGGEGWRRQTSGATTAPWPSTTPPSCTARSQTGSTRRRWNPGTVAHLQRTGSIPGQVQSTPYPGCSMQVARLMARYLAPTQASRTVEIGAGECSLASQLWAAARLASPVLCVDPCMEMLALGGQLPGVRVKVDTAERWAATPDTEVRPPRGSQQKVLPSYTTGSSSAGRSIISRGTVYKQL